MSPSPHHLNRHVLSELLGHRLQDLFELVQLRLHVLDRGVTGPDPPLEGVDERVPLLHLLDLDSERTLQITQ